MHKEKMAVESEARSTDSTELVWQNRDKECDRWKYWRWLFAAAALSAHWTSNQTLDMIVDEAEKDRLVEGVIGLRKEDGGGKKELLWQKVLYVDGGVKDLQVLNAADRKPVEMRGIVLCIASVADDWGEGRPG